MAEAQRSTFKEFTAEREGKRVALLLDGKILTVPVINSALQGGGVIEGHPVGSPRKR
ncbi:MAG: hypothetical protein R3F17_13300 [Planctomycetota bacterium]